MAGVFLSEFKQVSFDKQHANNGMKVFIVDYSVDGPPIEHGNFIFTKKFLGLVDHRNMLACSPKSDPQFISVLLPNGKAIFMPDTRRKRYNPKQIIAKLSFPHPLDSDNVPNKKPCDLPACWNE